MSIGIRIVLGVIGILYSVWILSTILKKHSKIDTESIAVVQSVQDLGIDDFKKVYAIKYDIKSSDPFELIVSPCKKILKPGKERVVFYEKDNPQRNYYFKTIGQFDRRFLLPVLLLLASLITIAAPIFELF